MLVIYAALDRGAKNHYEGKMRTCSGDNPYAPPFDKERTYEKYARHERAAVEGRDVRDFLCCLWRLADEGKKATGNSGNLPSGIFSEQVRQIARKKGWAECVTGQGWILTDLGRNIVAGQI